MKKYMNAGAELSEAVLEVMKNMLLCMSKDKVGHCSTVVPQGLPLRH